MRERNLLKFQMTGLFSLIFSFVLVFFLAYAQELPEQIVNAQAQAELINLNLKNVDLKDALKIISQASGKNIVTDKDVSAQINITMKNVSWETALDNMLKTNELTYRISNDIIRVMTLTTIKKEEELSPLETKIITLNFAKAEELQGSLKKLLSARGNIEINVPTNSLIISEIPEFLAKLESVAKELDTPTPQVLVEALIVSAKLTDTDKFGIDWTATHKRRPERKASQTLKAASSTLDLFYGKTILPNWNFTAQLALFAEDKTVKILANPRIITLDNLMAQIEILEQVPYTFTSQSTDGSTAIESTQFKDIGIKLYVTPHITKDRFISISVKAEQSFVSGFTPTEDEPIIDTRKAETNLLLKDGETVVIGGLRKKDNTTTIDKIPLLGDIPFIGKLFKKETREISDTELIIFITPRVMDDVSLEKTEREKFNSAKDELFSEKNKRDKVITDAIKNQEYKITANLASAPPPSVNEIDATINKRQIESPPVKIDEKTETPTTSVNAGDNGIEPQNENRMRQENALEKELKNKTAFLYENAIDYYNSNRFDKAIEIFSEILNLNPNEKKAKVYLEKKIPAKIEKIARQKEKNVE